MPLGISHRVAAHSFTLCVVGEIDVATCDEFRVALHHACEYAVDRAVVVDLDAVTFIDAGGVGALVAAANHLRGRSKRLTVRTGQPSVLRLLRVCRLHNRMTVKGTCSRARRSGAGVEPPRLRPGSTTAPSSPATRPEPNGGSTADGRVVKVECRRQGSAPEPILRASEGVAGAISQWQTDSALRHQAMGVLIQRHGVPVGEAEAALAELADELGISVSALARAIVADLNRRS
ncbi:MAG TPA: STAS domain-containing protein [Nocardioidaceae bacterium]|nr:STAS domain-containing protein [Nocardioidaceae bacterium]